MKIKANLLKFIRSELSKDYEICGNIITSLSPSKKEEAVFINVKDGKTIGGRLSCAVDRLFPVNFHTHPLKEKSYPSAEDIVALLKNKAPINPLIEIIFTRWGIWKIQCTEKPKAIDKDTMISELTTKFLDRLYFQTSRGRADDVEYKVINTFIQQIEDYLRMKGITIEISFQKWEDVKIEYAI